MTIEQAIQQVHARGLRVNNMFQDRERWDATIEDEQCEHRGFGAADTLAQALLDALDDYAKKAAPAEDMEDMLG